MRQELQHRRERAVSREKTCSPRVAFHTYPEHRYIALDIFSCGRADAKAALSFFLAALEPGRVRIATAARGTEIPYRDRVHQAEDCSES